MVISRRQGTGDKVAWQGRLLGVQPRIRLMRSFDERAHTYLGYVLRISGECDDRTGEFLIAVGEGAQAKHGFCRGMMVAGSSVPVSDPRLETAAFYKTTGLKVDAGSDDLGASLDPPCGGAPPALDVYRSRGHRRLDPRTYGVRCLDCIWGCRMPVEIVVDHWNPSRRQYRFECFCYGPKSCALHRAGTTRKVPGRRGMSWEEEDWVDEEATAHRDPDE